MLSRVQGSDTARIVWVATSFSLFWLFQRNLLLAFSAKLANVSNFFLSAMLFFGDLRSVGWARPVAPLSENE
jgi:hypothetical protein